MTSAAAAGLRAFSSSSTSSSAPSSASSPFSPPSALPQRRVVVTGLGLVTPLGVGVQQSWSNLIQGAVGVKALTVSDMQNLPAAQQALLEQLPCKVGALVPKEPLAAALARIKEVSLGEVWEKWGQQYWRDTRHLGTRRGRCFWQKEGCGISGCCQGTQHLHIPSTCGSTPFC